MGQCQTGGRLRGMINVPTPEELLHEMFSLWRPGGTIVLEDADDTLRTCAVVGGN